MISIFKKWPFWNINLNKILFHINNLKILKVDIQNDLMYTFPDSWGPHSNDDRGYQEILL